MKDKSRINSFWLKKISDIEINILILIILKFQI